MRRRRTKNFPVGSSAKSHAGFGNSRTGIPLNPGHDCPGFTGIDVPLIRNPQSHVICPAVRAECVISGWESSVALRRQDAGFVFTSSRVPVTAKLLREGLKGGMSGVHLRILDFGVK